MFLICFSSVLGFLKFPRVKWPQSGLEFLGFLELSRLRWARVGYSDFELSAAPEALGAAISNSEWLQKHWGQLKLPLAPEV